MKRIGIIGLCLTVSLGMSSVVAASAAAAGSGGRPAQGGANATAFTVAEFPISAAEYLRSITAGPEGNVWFVDVRSGGVSRIGRITSSGEIAEFPIPASGIAAGPDGNLWFTESSGNGLECCGKNKIGRITPSGTITAEFPLPRSEAGEDLTAGPDGNLWFTGSEGLAVHNLGRITLSGAVTVFPFPGEPGTGTVGFGMITGPDANVWFLAMSDSTRIARIGPTGTITTFPVFSGGRPGSLVAGADGNVWFVANSQRTGLIGRITPSGAVRTIPLPAMQGAPTLPDGIAVGRDGNMWFTSGGRVVPTATPAHPHSPPVVTPGLIGRIAPTGKVSEFPLPTLKTSLLMLTAGRDGSLWGVTRVRDNVDLARITSQLFGARSRATCVVPKLKGQTIARAKKLLGRARCKLGKVTQPAKHKSKLVVVSQKPAAKNVLPSGAKVSLRLG